MNRLIITGAAAVLLMAGCTACSSSSTSTNAAAVGGAASSASASASADTSGGSTSGDSSSAAAGSTADPCSLATAAQIQAIFGGTVAEGALSTDPSEVNPTCEWQVTGSNLGGAGEVDIFYPLSLQDATKFGYAKDGTPGAVDVPGIGDAAFYDAKTEALSFVKGDTVVTVQSVFVVDGGNTPNAATTQQQLTALATQVAGSL